MRNLSIISNNKLTSGLEIFLAVGNMGDTIMYLLPSNEALVYPPPPKILYNIYALLTKCEEGFFICSITNAPEKNPSSPRRLLFAVSICPLAGRRYPLRTAAIAPNPVPFGVLSCR